MPVTFPLLSLGAAPTQAVNEVQRLTPSGTVSGGTFTISYGGQTTTAIVFNATAAVIQAALEALSTIGAGNVLCAGGPVNSAFVSITFQGALGGLNVSQVTVDGTNLTGSTPAITPTTTTAGVRGSYRGAQTGALLQDTTNGNIYQNTGSANTPAWSDLGA